MAMRSRWLLYQEERKARGAPISPPAPEEGGLVAAAPAVDSKIARSTHPHSTEAVAETPRPGCPVMPVGPPGLAEHRDILNVDPNRSLMAMVARSVTRKEILTTPAASKSLSDEAAKLVQKGAWDPNGGKGMANRGGRSSEKR